MIEQSVKILNDEGMHARPAASFVKEANTFSSEVEIAIDGNSTNGKSIMALMSLGLKKDTTITIKASGDDEAACMKRLVELVNNKFE